MKAIIDKYNTRTEIDVDKVHDETIDEIIDLIHNLKKNKTHSLKWELTMNLGKKQNNL